MIKYVFVTAAGHSGSTLLDLLLGAHPNGLSLGEINQLPKNIALNTVCSCGAKLSDCKFWQPILEQVNHRLGTVLADEPYDLFLGYINATKIVDIDHQTRFRDLRRRICYASEFAWRSCSLKGTNPLATSLLKGTQNKVSLFDLILGVTGASYVVDSSKHYMDAVHLYEQAPQNSKILLLIRDGRAVFNSGLKIGLGRRQALQAWLFATQRATRIFGRCLPANSFYKVHYENLAADPRREISAICNFIGYPFATRMLDFSNAEHHIANGNNMRFTASSKIELDEKWRKELSHQDLLYFEQRAGQLNRALGYKD